MWTRSNVAHNATCRLPIDLTIVINVTQSHRHHTMEFRCSSLRTVFAVDKVVPVGVLISVKFNYMYFMTSLRGKNEVKVKFENSMHNYNATPVHRHHTLGCQCSSFGTCDVKWYPSEYWSLKNWTILGPRYKVKMRLRLNVKTACTTTMPP